MQQVRVGLAADGCSVSKNFLSPAGLDAILGEAEERKSQTYYAPKKVCNIYLGEGNPDEAEDHPQNHFMERSNGFITSDLLGEGTANEADSERLLLIQSFCEEDGVTGNPLRVKDLYGKTTALHKQSRNVSDKLLD